MKFSLLQLLLWVLSVVVMFTDTSLEVDVPTEIQNAMAIVYRPTRGQNDITALLVWNQNDVEEQIDTYTVEISRNGSMIFSGSVDGNTTHLAVTERSSRNELLYPLQLSSVYNVVVFANNSHGKGLISNLNLSTIESTPPMDVFIITNDSEGRLLSKDFTWTTSSLVALDNVNRKIYWYSIEEETLFQTTMDNGKEKILYPSLAAILQPLALSYDWVGQTVYLAALVKGSFTIWRVPVINPDGLEMVYEDKSTVSTNIDAAKITMDPFNGYVYWSVTREESTSFFMLDLRSNLSIPIFSELNLSPALTLNPATGCLLVSNKSNGDILSCEPHSSNCSIEVMAADVLLSSGNHEIGLPATSIAIDELRIYWTQFQLPGVYFISLNNPSLLNVLSSSAVASQVLTNSPGQQPLPVPRCLSPDLVENNRALTNRPIAQQILITSTTILVRWNQPQLPPECSGITFSFPTLTYRIIAFHGMILLEGYPMVLFENELLLKGLMPYTEYELRVEATNQYTVARFSFHFDVESGAVQAFGPDSKVMTKEGIPFPPTDLIAFPTGTHEMNVSWTPPLFLLDGNFINDLNGNPNNQYFYIYSKKRVLAKTKNTTIELSDLVPDTTYNIKVVTFNGVFKSTAAETAATTWPLPPPVEYIITSGPSYQTANASVTLYPNHFPILELYLLASIENSNSTIVSKTEYLNGTMIPQSGHIIHFSIGSENNPLQLDEEYSIQSVALYIDSEYRTGPITELRFSKIPDAPVVTLMVPQNILSWTVPQNNGAPILMYKIVSNSSLQESHTLFVDGMAEREIDLTSSKNFNLPTVYKINVFAINMVGESPPSNTVAFNNEIQVTELEEEFPIALTIGVSISGFIFLACAVLLIMFLLFVFLKKRKAKKSHPCYGISVLYGPAHELFARKSTITKPNQ